MDATDHATAATHANAEAGWRSVLVEGPLSIVTGDGPDAAITQSVRTLRAPYFDVFGRRHDELEFAMARLEAASVSGIAEG